MTKRSRKSAAPPRAGSAPAPAEWLASNPPRRPGVPCPICIDHEAARIVTEFESLNAPRERTAVYLRTVHGMPHMTHSIVGNHVRNHGDR